MTTVSLDSCTPIEDDAAHTMASMAQFCPMAPIAKEFPAPAPNVVSVNKAPGGKARRGRDSTAMKVWDYEEDQRLFSAVQQMGKRWHKIAELLPDRTEAMCRNRYSRICMPFRPEMKGFKTSKNKCNTCGQFKKGHSCEVKGKLFVQTDPGLTTTTRPEQAPTPALQMPNTAPLSIPEAAFVLVTPPAQPSNEPPVQQPAQAPAIALAPPLLQPPTQPALISQRSTEAMLSDAWKVIKALDPNLTTYQRFVA